MGTLLKCIDKVLRNYRSCHNSGGVNCMYLVGILDLEVCDPSSGRLKIFIKVENCV
jgi:hypothetical protein